MITSSPTQIPDMALEKSIVDSSDHFHSVHLAAEPRVCGTAVFADNNSLYVCSSKTTISEAASSVRSTAGRDGHAGRLLPPALSFADPRMWTRGSSPCACNRGRTYRGLLGA